MRNLRQSLRAIARWIKRRLKATVGKDFFYKPDIKLAKSRLGTDYGGWEVILDELSRDSVVYSFGIGEDISFDLELIRLVGTHVYGFDPTPRSIKWVKEQTLPKEFILFEYGLSGENGFMSFNPPGNPEYVSYSIIGSNSNSSEAIQLPVRSLGAIMAELGHDKLDLLKMDIEGAEYDVIESLVVSGIRPQQLLVEFHHRFDGVGIGKSKHAIETLRQSGYQIYSVSDTGEEYSFVYSPE